MYLQFKNMILFNMDRKNKKSYVEYFKSSKDTTSCTFLFKWSGFTELVPIK